jgi:hypothetical protein
LEPTVLFSIWFLTVYSNPRVIQEQPVVIITLMNLPVVVIFAGNHKDKVGTVGLGK